MYIQSTMCTEHNGGTYIIEMYMYTVTIALHSDQSTVDEEDGVWDSHFSAEPSLSTIRSPQMEVFICVDFCRALGVHTY